MTPPSVPNGGISMNDLVMPHKRPAAIEIVMAL